MATLTYASKPVTSEQIAHTTKMLRSFRAFLDSEYTEMSAGYGSTLTKNEARRKLHFLLDVAVNRRAGIPDVPARKHSSEYQLHQHRDRWRIHDIVTRRVRT